MQELIKTCTKALISFLEKIQFSELGKRRCSTYHRKCENWNYSSRNMQGCKNILLWKQPTSFMKKTSRFQLLASYLWPNSYVIFSEQFLFCIKYIVLYNKILVTDSMSLPPPPSLLKVMRTIGHNWEMEKICLKWRVARNEKNWFELGD